jgi:hypothetical protein
MPKALITSVKLKTYFYANPQQKKRYTATMTEQLIPIGDLIMIIAVYIESLVAVSTAFVLVSMFIYTLVKIAELISRVGTYRYRRVPPPAEPEYSPIVPLQSTSPV